MHTISRWVTAIGFGLAATSPALAQFGIASLTHADGGVTRVHRGAPAATTIGVSLMDGDQIATTDGRAEIGFPDGTLLHLDRNASVILHAGERIEARSGRVSLRIGSQKGYIAETASARMHVQAGSVVEITSRPDRPDVQLRVISGAARIETPSGAAQVPDYHNAVVAGPSSAPAVTKVVPTLADEFERWALARVVLATSTPLRGTENGGGVAYYPYAYYPSAYAWYPAAYYPVYYSTPYYVAPYYVAPYYGSTYYANPYGSSYYHPSQSYYSGYSSYYGGASYASSYRTPSYRERYSWTVPSTPPAATPGAPSSGGPSSSGAAKAAVPKP